MKNFKYLAVAVCIAALALTGCGEAAENDGVGGETIDAEVNSNVAASPDVDTTYPAYDVSAGETAATASASLTVYTNHTVSFTDGTGNTMKGFIFVDRYAMGDTTSDMAFLMDSTTNGVKYLTNLVYTDDSSNQVTLAEATAVGFTESDTNSNYETIGNLVLMGSSESVAPGMVYELFLSQTNIDLGVYNGNCFTYNTATKECDVAWWEGAFTSGGTDYSQLNGITISVYDDSGNVSDTTNIGQFETVIAALGSGPVEAADTSIAVTSKTYKALSNEYGTDYMADTTESITIYSNGMVDWTDSDGKTWEGFYFKNCSNLVATANSGHETFMEFTDGQTSQWFEVSFYIENGDTIEPSTEDQGTCIWYMLESGSGLTEDMTGYSHLSEKLCKIATASAAAPNEIFLIYFNEDNSSVDYDSIGNYYGDVIIYDYSTGKYKDSQWTAPLDGFDTSTFSTIQIWTDQMGGNVIEGSMLD